MRGYLFTRLCDYIKAYGRMRVRVHPVISGWVIVEAVHGSGDFLCTIDGSAKCRHKARRELQAVANYIYDLYNPTTDTE